MFYCRLDFATERITLLDANVADLTAEKAKDAQMYSTIIAKSKFILRDHLRASRSTDLGRSECVVDDIADNWNNCDSVLQSGQSTK